MKNVRASTPTATTLKAVSAANASLWAPASITQDASASVRLSVMAHFVAEICENSLTIDLLMSGAPAKSRVPGSG